MSTCKRCGYHMTIMPSGRGSCDVCQGHYPRPEAWRKPWATPEVKVAGLSGDSLVGWIQGHPGRKVLCRYLGCSVVLWYDRQTRSMLGSIDGEPEWPWHDRDITPDCVAVEEI